MKKFILILFVFNYTIILAQIINIPDANFKNKLLQSSISNAVGLDINNQPIVININGNNEIEVNEAQLVYWLLVFNSSISDVTGIEYFTNLNGLQINQNSLINLNLSTLTQLKTLRCDLNMLSSLDLTGLTQLEALNIGYNNFSTIDINNLPNLKRAFFHYNHFTTLDFSNNPLLSVLQCRNNNLSTLTLKNGINQDFSITGLNDCWKTGNPNLTTICVDDSELASVQNYLNSCDTTTPTPVITSANCGLANEEFAVNEVVVYPNPSNGIVNIYSKEGIKKLELYDFQGRMLVSKNINVNQSILDVSAYSKGVYFVKIVNENSNKVEKIIVE